jgi:2-dehydro-3-deoxyphosphogluconate aldolase / (4S)-4-hydroxy-2-oxoglutarate aldolase
LNDKTERHSDLITQIQESFVVGVLRLHTTQAIVQTAETFVEKGVTVLEVPWSVPQPAAAVQALRHRFGSSRIIGAGTALTLQDLEQAASAGCQFAASPVCPPGWVDNCYQVGMLPIPGALTPTEVEAVLAQGAQVVKLFPISALGGAGYISSLSGPFSGVRWMPCGGITWPDVPHYKAAGAWAVGLGRQAVVNP